MRFKHLLLFFVLLVVTTSEAQTIHDEESFVAKTIDGIHFIEQHQKVIWPAFHMNLRPVIIHFANQHFYALHFKPVRPEWQKKRINNEDVYFVDHDVDNLADTAMVLQIAVEGQPSYLYRYMDYGSINENDNLHTLFHERFHAHQLLEQPFPIGFFIYQGFNQADNVVLANLEAEILKDYVANPNHELLKDYVAVNQIRFSLLDEDSKRYEEQKEYFEGLAEYVSWRTVFQDGRNSTAIINDYTQKCKIDKLVSCMIHNRYYFTGYVIGVALDHESPGDWKSIFIQSNISPHMQLLQLFPMSKEELSQRLASVKIRYRYEEMIKPIEDAVKTYQTELNDHQKKFKEMPGIVLRIDPLPCSLQGYTKLAQSYYLNSDDQLEIGVSVTALCSDKSIMLTHVDLPYRFVSTRFNQECKVSNDALLAIDEKKIMLNEILHQSTSLPFSTLYLKDGTTELKIERSGKIVPHDGRLTVQVDNFSKKHLRSY
ncbi:MAG: hypothetical protein A3F11_12025 [Gammaproteobacteria bacterium RIFCSPHIGHO2_12_FULL_37_14]|nr:MAG: hypothetical protein A3F11_12025 [Gammaproteobacteria bacterium RIFCSPHIGHO2_12_FULL_37_14]